MKVLANVKMKNGQKQSPGGVIYCSEKLTGKHLSGVSF